MSESIIQTRALDFFFKDFRALHQVNLNVPRGSIYGFLGPNGAGKTTTIRILLDLFHPQAGQVRIFDKPLRPHREEILGKVGALIENPSIYKHLSGRQNLEVIRKMVGCPRERIDEVLRIVRLLDNADKRAKHYSLGMCQRLGLAGALLTDPELLILDEPTNGLDPSGIIEMRELIIRLNQEHGKTIFLSSHMLSEIEKLATDVAIIDQGKILYEGPLAGLQENADGLQLTVEVDHVNTAAEVLSKQGFKIAETHRNALQIALSDRAQIAEINQLLVASGIAVYQLTSTAHDLEAVFLTLTKKLDQ